MFTRGNKTNRAHVNKKGIYLKERRDDTISFIVIAIVSPPRDKRSLVEPLYISTCISRIKRLLYTTHNEVLQ